MKLKNSGLMYKFLSFSIGAWIALFLSFFTTPIITRIFSPTEYGRMSIFNVFVSLLNAVLFIGLDQSFTRYFYKVNKKNRRMLLYNCISIPMILTLLLCIILSLFWKRITLILFNEYSFTAWLLIILRLLFLVLYRFSLQMVRMNQHGKQYSILNILEKASYICVALVLSLYSRSYIILVLSLTFSSIITAILGIMMELKEWRKPSKLFDKNIIDSKELIKYGAPLTINFLIFWLFQSIDKIFIQKFWGFKENGIYAGAFTFVTILTVVQTTFSSFWVPVAFEKFENDKDAKAFYIKINTLVSFAMIILGIIIISFKDLIVLLLGESYRGAVNIMPFLLFIPLMFTISETTVNGINFYNKSKLHVIISVSCCVVNIVGNYLFVPTMGAKGAAIATGISYILFLILRTEISNKYYPVKFNTKELYISILLLFFLALYSTFEPFGIQSIIYAIICILGVLLTYMKKLKACYNF